MTKWIAAMLALGVIASAHAAPEEDTYNSVLESANSSCRAGPASMCWEPFAERLAKIKAPSTERAREDQLFDYYLLAKIARLSGDFSDSAKFFNMTLAMAKEIKANDKDLDGSLAYSAFVSFDVAALDLSTHDYAAALQNLDKFSSFVKTQSKDEFPSMTLLRCSALIGLKRNAEAEAALQHLLEKLDFNGESPWEGYPFGPQPLNPYEAARRIAAYYMREGQNEKALDLLRMIESRREKKLLNAPAGSRYWASEVSPADIQEDEAFVYLAQGLDDQAEPLLRTALAIREKKPDNQLKRALNRLATFDRRKGQSAEADAYELRAKDIKTEQSGPGVDPLADTLGFAD